MNEDGEKIIAEGLIEIHETFTQVVEAGKGFRSLVLNEGWSIEQANEVSAAYMKGIIAQVTGTARFVPEPEPEPGE